MKNILIPLTIFIVIFISSCGGEEETSDVINCVDKYDCPETMQCIDGVCSDKCVDNSDCPMNLYCYDGECKEKQVVDKDENIPDEMVVADENEVVPDESEEPDNEVNDEDSTDKPIPCTEHENCPEDKYCFKNYCINPFLNKWKIGLIDLCVNDENGEGDNWDPSISFKPEPEPYVVAYFNDKQIFQTTPPDDSHCATYTDTFETFLISGDVLKFDVYDEDDGLDVFTGDDHIDTITVTPILVEYLRNGSYSATGMNNMKTFNFVITSVNE